LCCTMLYHITSCLYGGYIMFIFCFVMLCYVCCIVMFYVGSVMLLYLCHVMFVMLCYVILCYVMLCYVNHSFSCSSYLACHKTCLPHEDHWRPFTQVFVDIAYFIFPILTKLRSSRLVLIPFPVHVITSVYW